MPCDQIVIGWKEYLDFVDWRLGRVKAKIDTGARTSVLGVLSYEVLDNRDGDKQVTFRVIVDRRHPDRVQEVVTPVLRMLVVSNSGGLREQRPLVETTLQIGPVVKRVRMTITNRLGMRFGMLLGRKALEGSFIVDVDRKYLLKKFKKS